MKMELNALQVRVGVRAAPVTMVLVREDTPQSGPITKHLGAASSGAERLTCESWMFAWVSGRLQTCDDAAHCASMNRKPETFEMWGHRAGTIHSGTCKLSMLECWHS